MQKIRTSLLCVSAAIVVGLGSSAMAADIAVDSEPMADWTSLRIGIGGGYGMILHDGFLDVEGVVADDDGPDEDFSHFLDLNDLGDGSGLGTVEVGFDFQLGERIVAGIQGDYTFANFNSEASDYTCRDDGGLDVDCTGLRAQVDTDSMWTVAARLGVLSSPETLWYGLIGWTSAKVDARGQLLAALDDDDPIDVLTPDIFDDDDRVDGITFGGGIETMLSQNFTLKLEGRYTKLGDIKDSVVYPDDDEPELEGVDSEVDAEIDEYHYDFDSDILSVRAVLSWRLPIF
jgi:opacity protein-like surface antigen